MTVKEAAERANVNEETIRRNIRGKNLPATIRSRKEGYFIDEDDLDEWIKNKHHRSTKDLYFVQDWSGSVGKTPMIFNNKKDAFNYVASFIKFPAEDDEHGYKCAISFSMWKGSTKD